MTAIYAPGAPAAIWAMDELDDGAKLTLAWLWSRADHAIQRDPRPVEVWVPVMFDEQGKRIPAGRALLLTIQQAVHPTKSLRTIRGHLARAKALGLALADGRLVHLTPPGWPRKDTERQHKDTERPHRGTPDGGQWLPPDGHTKTPSGHTKTLSGHNSPPHTNHPIPPNNPPPPPTIATEFALTHPEATGPPRAKRDLVAEVYAHWTQQVAETREWAGLVRGRDGPMRKGVRKLIAERLAEIEGTDEERLDMAKRVIAVQVHQARSEGQANGDKTRRAKIAASKSWKFFQIATVFAGKNFDRWLDRWDPGGEHEVWVDRPAQAANPRAGRNAEQRRWSEMVKAGTVPEEYKGWVHKMTPEQEAEADRKWAETEF